MTNSVIANLLVLFVMNKESHVIVDSKERGVSTHHVIERNELTEERELPKKNSDQECEGVTFIKSTAPMAVLLTTMYTYLYSGSSTSTCRRYRADITMTFHKTCKN